MKDETDCQALESKLTTSAKIARVKEYLVLKPVVLKIEGLTVANFHEKGSIYLSYAKKSDAEKESKNGKYPIYELEANN
jgi:hypothetical protein